LTSVVERLLELGTLGFVDGLPGEALEMADESA
jgi:hypothetical protein